MPAPAVECVDLSHSFHAVRALAGLSFTVATGEFFALLGPNGAGKTTLLNILMTIHPPTAGRAAVMGHDVVAGAAEVRRALGVVFQEPALDERLTARENLAIHAVLYALPRGQRREAVEQALAWASLQDAAARVVKTFSGGMKRRLELARALMHGPRVLLLDEPTIALDPQGRLHLWERIATLRDAGITVLMTTHNLPEAEACDRVGIIDRGRLIALGPPAALIAEHGAANLEAVFIALTGRQLRDETATARDRMVSFSARGGEFTR